MAIGNPNLVHFSPLLPLFVAENQTRFYHPVTGTGTTDSLQNRFLCHDDALIFEGWRVNGYDFDVGIPADGVKIAFRKNGAILTHMGDELNVFFFSGTPVLIQSDDLLQDNGMGGLEKLRCDKGDTFNFSIQGGNFLNPTDRRNFSISWWGTWNRSD